MAPQGSEEGWPVGRSRRGRGREDKAAWWISMAGCARGRISNVGGSVEAHKFRQIKAASGRRSALHWIWFWRPFHLDCICGEVWRRALLLGFKYHEYQTTSWSGMHFVRQKMVPETLNA